jgi:hypothetical protein
MLKDHLTDDAGRVKVWKPSVLEATPEATGDESAGWLLC